MNAIQSLRSPSTPDGEKAQDHPNVAAIRTQFEALTAGDLDAAVATVTDDVVVYTSVPGVQPGRAGYRAFLELFLTAFPDQWTEIHETLVAGDRVVVRHTHHVVHGGPFAGMPSTGKRASVDGLALFRFVNGKVAEMWHHDDLLSLLQQLGAFPPADGGSEAASPER